MYRNTRRNRQTLQNEHSEDFRIGIDIIFRDFCADPSVTEYTFEPNLNNVERKYIHEKCRRLGLKSKSKGKEPNRILSMYKNVNGNSTSFELKLGNETLKVINSFVSKNCNGINTTYNDLHEVVCTNGGVDNLCFGYPPNVEPPRTGDYSNFKQNLPVFELKDYILHTIDENPVTIISGETGSGKTTQVPQYILEHCCSNRRPCRIICTQPRRISTVAVAERVSIERGEQIGETCGYQIKLDCRLGPDTALIYCTTGVLLRTLMSGFHVLNNITHIIIDEIHERDKFTDFVLISLRECLKQYPNLRLVLMSATLDVELFENYFGNVAKINVKGRTYPIEHFFLDRILVELNYESEQMKLVKMKSNIGEEVCRSVPENNAVLPQVDESLLREMDQAIAEYMGEPTEENFMQILHIILSDEVSVDQAQIQTGFTPLMVTAATGNLDFVQQLLNLGANISLKSQEGLTAIDWALKAGHPEVAKAIRDFDYMKRVSQTDVLSLYNQTILEDVIDHDLIVAIITYIHRTSFDNMGVLVFLPGYDDIMLQLEVLSASPIAQELKICVLHGSMMVNAQHDVFRRSNKRKIILSTNVAETSITIDDIAHVIDTGKVKQKSYDSLNGTSTLETTWISIASLKQRAGRAGRCAPGKCYHLFSRGRYESLLVNTIPEILTVPLHELCLQTKQLAPRGMKIADFLSKALEAPNLHVIQNALTDLVSLGALDSNENLTILGSHLLKLSIEPHLGKMVIYAVILKCLDPVLTIVATLAHKDPFVLPSKGFEKVEAGKKKKSLTFGTLSDHMGLLMAFQKWQEAKRSGSEGKFCREYYISSSCMEMISATRNHIVSQLRASGLVEVSSGIRNLTLYNESWPVVKAALSAGLYPNVAFSHNNKVISRNEKRVLMHSTSCIRGTSEYSSELWFIFEEISKLGNLCNLKGVTAVTPLTVVLTAGSTNRFDPPSNTMLVDDSLNINIHTETIWKFRLALDAMVQRHVAQPHVKTTRFEQELLTTLHTVLSAEDSLFKLIHPVGIGKKPNCGYNGMKVPNHVEANGFEPQFNQQPQPQPSQHQGWNGRNGDHGRNHFRRHQQGGWMNGAERRDNLPDNSSVKSGNSLDGISNDNERFGYTKNVLIDIMAPRPIRIGPMARFFVIRPVELNNIMISLSQGTWVFAPQTERKVFESFLNGFETYLFYTIRGSMEFQAVAQLINTSGESNSAADVNWLSTKPISYHEVSNFISPKITYFTDGTEIPYDSGVQIALKMMTRNEQRPKSGRPILDVPEGKQPFSRRQRWRRRKERRNQ